MTTQIKAKLLQHFAAKKKGNGGFTLIELLVVIIIIGILSAIALPSFLNQANKAKQSEAKTYVGSMNRAQQAYYLEEDEFASGIPGLGIGISQVTDSYNYVTDSTQGTSAAGTTAYSTAQPLTAASSVKAYTGAVEIENGTSTAIVCEALEPPVESSDDNDVAVGKTLTTLNSGDDAAVACSATYEPLN